MAYRTKGTIPKVLILVKPKKAFPWGLGLFFLFPVPRPVRSENLGPVSVHVMGGSIRVQVSMDQHTDHMVQSPLNRGFQNRKEGQIGTPSTTTKGRSGV